MKYPLQKNDNQFKYINNKKSILFNGSKVNKCQASEDKILALVINTGLNTNRGNLIQNILFPKNTNFRIFSEVKVFIIFLSSIFFVIIILYIVYQLMGSAVVKEASIGSKILDCLKAVIVFFPPSMLICINFTAFYFQYKLSNENISCISELRLNASGKVNNIVLDKTGTLTEEGLDLYGYQTTKINYTDNNPSQVDVFDNVELSLRLYNNIYTNFWTRLSNLNPEHELLKTYKDNYQTNMIYYVECLATCHSIDKINDEVLGNSIDKSIFDNLNWEQEVSKTYINGAEKV